MYFRPQDQAGKPALDKKYAGLKFYTPIVGLLIAVALLVAPALVEATGQASPIQADAAPKGLQYVESTGHSMIGPVLRFYTRTGGEDRHGKPLSELTPYKNHYIQYFERSLLEFYPEYDGSGQEVKMSALGQLVAADEQIDTRPVVPFIGSPDIWYFPETGHTLTGSFLTYWRNAGDAANLGQPITEELTTDGPDDSKLSVQYFENVRLQHLAGDKNGEVSITPLGTMRATKLLKPAQLAAIPKDRFLAPRTVRVPSLMFHYTRLVDERKDPLGYGLSITPDNYVKFLDWTVQNGYNTVTIDQVADYLKYGILLPDKPVSFRWDDGHDCDWLVYQEMKKRGMTATFYVISRRLELTPAQWQQIDNDGFEVAAHTRTHPDLRGVRDLADEITGSKIDMEAMLGHPVRDFAYPYGKYNDTIKQVVRNSGFEIATTTNGGYGWTPDNMLEQPTISVTGYDSVASFASKISAASSAPLQNSQPVSDNPPAKTSAPQPAPVKKTVAPAPSTPVPPKPATPKAVSTTAPKATPAPTVKK